MNSIYVYSGLLTALYPALFVKMRVHLQIPQHTLKQQKVRLGKKKKSGYAI